MRAWRAAAAAAALWMLAGATWAQMSAQAIMERNFNSGKISSVEGEATMVLINARGEQRKRKMSIVQKLRDGTEDSNILIRFLEPADIIGTVFLQIQNTGSTDNLWIYLPALHKARRLEADNQRDSFIGSDFSYGDILLPKVSLYSHTVLRSESIDGHDCYVIESKPVDTGVRDDYGYSRKVSWIDKDSFVEAKVEYYDTDGALLKTQTTSRAEHVDSENGRWLVLKRVMANHQTGHATVFEFDRYKVGVVVRDQIFSSNRLGRE